MTMKKSMYATQTFYATGISANFRLCKKIVINIFIAATAFCSKVNSL